MAEDPELTDIDPDIDVYDAEDEYDVSIEGTRGKPDRDQDGVAALQDVEAEQGDEAEVDDDFDLDTQEAHEAGVHLDPVADEEPRLN